MRQMLAPGPFSEIAGVHSVAMLDLIEHPQNGTFDKNPDSVSAISFAGDETAFTPRTIIESLVLGEAEPIAFVRGGMMAGKPAVTRNRYGRGWVFYVGVDCLEDEFYEIVAQRVVETCQLEPLIKAPRGVEVTSRQDSETTYYFVLNMTTQVHDRIALPHPMEDLIGGRKGVTQISLGPLEVAVLATT